MDVGIVGLGGQGRLLASAWLQLPGARIAAIYDPDPARRESFLVEHPGQPIRSADSLESLLAEGPLDCVCLCSPPVAHPDQAAACFQQGKHVFVEKPLAVDSDGARRLAVAAQSHRDRVCLVGSALLTFLPAVVAARDWLADQPLGQIETIRITYRLRHRPAGWFLNPDLSGGGVWIDLAYHPFSVLHYLLPACRSFDVQAARMGARERGSRVEDWANLLLVAQPESRSVLVDVAWDVAQAEGEIRLTGSEGELRIDLLRNEAVAQTRSARWEFRDHANVPPDLARLEMQYFQHCIEQATSPAVGSLDVALRTHALILEAYRMTANSR